jgi:acyl carrier protein
MDNRATIRKFIEELLHRKGDTASFADSDSLVLSGRLESIDVLDIVVFLESNYGVDFSDGDFDQTMLDNVNSVLAVVKAAPTVG